MRVVIYIRGELAYDIFVRGVSFLFEGCSEVIMYFLFFLLQIHCSCTLGLVTIFTHTLYLFSVYVNVCSSFTYPLHVLFLFSLYAHVSYYLYAIFYFCFILRCCDEFCLKCFRNTGCQSLLAMNSLLAKFFKSLRYDRFYCIQQVSMS